MDYFIQKRKHEKLYNMIPDFECKKDCSDCCGPVVFSKWEWSRINNKKEANGLICPYVSDDNRCKIYKKRPLLCRLFGVVEEMKCFHGIEPERYLTEKEQLEIIKKYDRLKEGNIEIGN